MADRMQLEALVQKMIDGGADDSTIREAVTLYKEKYPEQRGKMDVSSVADPEGGLALSNVAEQNPKAAVGGAVAGMAAPFVPWGAAATGAIRTLTHPGVAAVGGGIEGYRRGGVLGGIEGAIMGGTLGRLGRSGQLRTILGLGKEAATAAPAVATAAAEAAPAASRLVLSPAEAEAERLLLELAKRKASQQGMLNAARMQ